jgi:thiol-disulfide isomerase/thioredoxin
VGTGLIVGAAALVLSAVLGAVWRASNGRLRGPAPARARGPGGMARARSDSAVRPPRLTADDLGGPLGTRATLVQFSTAICAPCRATRRILADVASAADGVTHVEIDAESRLDLVRKLDVRRTPTVFILGPSGEIARRGSGQPRQPDVIAAVETVSGSRLNRA